MPLICAVNNKKVLHIHVSSAFAAGSMYIYFKQHRALIVLVYEVGFITYPCALTKYCIHWMAGMLSCTASNSASLKFVVFNFCLLEEPFIIPCLNVMYVPEWLCMSSCNAKDPSMNPWFWSRCVDFMVSSSNFVLSASCSKWHGWAFCSHPNLASLLWCTGMLLLCVCQGILVCIGTTVVLSHDGTSCHCAQSV